MIPDEGKPILWEELSLKDVDKLTKTMKMAIIPIAAWEQHSPHLPLGVDTIDCCEVAKRVSAKTRASSSTTELWSLSEPW